MVRRPEPAPRSTMLVASAGMSSIEREHGRGEVDQVNMRGREALTEEDGQEAGAGAEVDDARGVCGDELDRAGAWARRSRSGEYARQGSADGGGWSGGRSRRRGRRCSWRLRG